MADANVKIRGGDSNATEIQSRAVDSAAPTDGQALAWSASDSEWEPTTVGGGGSSEWTDTGSVLHPSEETVDNVVVGGTTTANSDIVLGVDGHAVFNEQGSDVDFRVEGDTKTHLLFVDGGTNRVGINTNAPGALLEIDAGGVDNTEAFAVTEGGVDRLAIETDFGTAGNPARLKSDAVNPIMTIMTTTGNIGVASTSPSAKVQIYKDTEDSRATDDLGEYDNYHLVMQGASDTGDKAGLMLTSAASGWGGSSIIHYDTGAGGKGDLAFYTKQSANEEPPTEILRLKDDGRAISDFTASAWVSFDGTGTIAINDSYNVSSLTDSGTGDYVVNYATSLGNTNYSAYAGSWAPSSTGTLGLAVVGAITVNGADVTNRYVVDSGSGASCGYCYYDAERMSVVIFGGN